MYHKYIKIIMLSKKIYISILTPWYKYSLFKGIALLNLRDRISILDIMKVQNNIQRKVNKCHL